MVLRAASRGEGRLLLGRPDPGAHRGVVPEEDEAIELRNWDEATEHIRLVSDMLDRVSEALEQATRILKS